MRNNNLVRALVIAAGVFTAYLAFVNAQEHLKDLKLKGKSPGLVDMFLVMLTIGYVSLRLYPMIIDQCIGIFFNRHDNNHGQPQAWEQPEAQPLCLRQ